MKDSLPENLQSDKVPTTVMTLVAEENLESMIYRYFGVFVFLERNTC